MSTSITGQASSISKYLRTAKKALQDVILDAEYVWNDKVRHARSLKSAFSVRAPPPTRLRLDHLTKSSSGRWLTRTVFQVDDLERDAIEILRLIKSLRNRLAPISRIPPEVLTLIPDFLDTRFCDRNVITLSHVCRAWREMFISRSSLWSNFNCVNADKTRVYFERSGSSPINLRLRRGLGLSSLYAFLQIIPQAICRLKSLSVSTEAEDLQETISYLSHPAPLLETLDIDGGRYDGPQYFPVLAPTIFNGDLSSLRRLHLECVRTELPWKNMANLTSFTLNTSSVGNLGQLLDFFETAPHLRKIGLLFATLISGGESGRLVSLDHLEKMEIIDCGPTSILLDHLVIPVGAKLVSQPDSDTFIIEDHVPKSLDNLNNLSSIAKIHLHLDGFQPLFVRLSGLYGQFCIMAMQIGIPPSLALESLARFDTSKTKWLRIDSSSSPLSRDVPYRALLPMKNLRTLVLSRCTGLLCAFMDVLNPNTSPLKEVICPSLEELVFVLRLWKDDEEEFDIQSVIEMAAARAARGAKLGTVKDRAELDPADVLELRKHVSHVEYGPEVLYEDGSDGSDLED